MLRKYKQIDDSLIHIEFIPAPDYLLFTSMCYIGIVTYDPFTLNTAYCAPNKIFEYAAFGKPMIANNIPGLKVLSEAGAGETINENDISSIKEAILLIDKDYEKYRSAALGFFNSVDNEEIISRSLKSLD